MNRSRKRFSANVFPCLIDSSVNMHCDQCHDVFDAFVTHRPLLKKITHTISRSFDQSEDLLQSFYLKKLSRKSHHFRLSDPSFNVRQYLVKMFRNFCVDELKSWQKHRCIDLEYVEDLGHLDQGQTTSDLCEQLMMKHEISRIESALSEKDFDLLQRMLKSDWSIKAEAERYCVTEVAIRARLRRMRKRLKEKLGT